MKKELLKYKIMDYGKVHRPYHLYKALRKRFGYTENEAISIMRNKYFMHIELDIEYHWNMES